ncbi:MAG: type II toxin-antitoxin system VapC family toxin [Rhizobiales bacterium]|nr:type II toxin-antitoxin system VapC family toxin [Hyphomicrobiales bacterium]MBI3673149.1 type II toxin-antitoxin system VapC family toxin [Hyphomicrobiales bacterium]
MIILDTDIISELMRPEPDPRVVDWLRQRRVKDVFTTSVSEAELWFGVELLPVGKRRNDIAARLQATLDGDFSGRILDFDRRAAREFGRLHAAQRRSGRLSDLADAMIAAIASAKKFAVATRNMRDFAHAGVDLFNPWTD